MSDQFLPEVMLTDDSRKDDCEFNTDKPTQSRLQLWDTVACKLLPKIILLVVTASANTQSNR